MKKKNSSPLRRGRFLAGQGHHAGGLTESRKKSALTAPSACPDMPPYRTAI